MTHNIKIYDLLMQKNDNFFDYIILPNQTHSSNIIEIITGMENLNNCDGIFTSNKNNFSLAIKTADCAAIVVYDNNKYGIIHVGWRGLVGGIIEKMLNNFVEPQIFVGPILNEFEIKKDYCYNQIINKYGDKYFHIKRANNKETIIFRFKELLKQNLPDSAVFDGRDTYNNGNLASWRRDKDEKRNYTVINNKKI